MNAIQRGLPITTDSEVRMQRQLQNVERKVKDLTNALEQIKAKERYQLRQIQQSQENTQTRMRSHEMTASSTSLAPNQVENMKDVLQQDGQDLKDMMHKLNRMKKELF